VTTVSVLLAQGSNNDMQAYANKIGSKYAARMNSPLGMVGLFEEVVTGQMNEVLQRGGSVG